MLQQASTQDWIFYSSPFIRIHKHFCQHKLVKQVTFTVNDCVWSNDAKWCRISLDDFELDCSHATTDNKCVTFMDWSVSLKSNWSYQEKYILFLNCGFILNASISLKITPAIGQKISDKNVRAKISMIFTKNECSNPGISWEPFWINQPIQPKFSGVGQDWLS